MLNEAMTRTYEKIKADDQLRKDRQNQRLTSPHYVV